MHPRRRSRAEFGLVYLSCGLVRVCEIELSHMGKNNGYPDLVCEKSFVDMGKKTKKPYLVCKKMVSKYFSANMVTLKHNWHVNPD